jgi:redox-regulated HSP33 family molecular chaperone
LRGVVAIATGSGTVRGYVGSPMLGEMSLPEAVGKGSVQVVKNHPDWPRPYNGITAIRHGDIDRDVGKQAPSHRASFGVTSVNIADSARRYLFGGK